MSVTMQQVAKHAGVSSTAVSFVLNNKQRADGSISDETRQRVIESAAELGYHRNELARAAITRHNPVLGFLVHNPSAEAPAAILDGALEEAEKHGYLIKVLRLSSETADREALDQCLRFRLGGLLVLYGSAALLDNLHKQQQKAALPVVMVDSSLPQKWNPRVLSDDLQGFQLAVEHLASLGHRRIGCVGGSAEPVNSGYKPPIDFGPLRVAAFRAAMKNAGLEVHPDDIVDGRLQTEPTVAAVRALLGKPQRPSALIGITDPMAMAALRAAYEMNLRVPDRLSIVGYGNLKMAEHCAPPLSSVAQPFRDMGRLAVQQLLAQIDDASNARATQLLPAQLVLRASTAPPF